MSGRDPPTPIKSQAKRPKTPTILEASGGASSSDVRNIGNIRLVPLQNFSGKKIPTNSEVLRRIFWLRDQSNNASWKDIYKQVISELKVICGKALAIPKPTKDPKHLEKILQNLNTNYLNMNRHQARNISDKEKDFLASLDKMCEIVSTSAEDQIKSDTVRSEYKKQVDLYFLKDQRSRRRIEIDEKEDVHYQKRLLEQMSSELQVSEPVPEHVEIEEVVESNVEDESFEPSRYLRENRQSGSDSRKNTESIIKNKELLKTFDRAKISDRKATMLTGAYLGASGEDIGTQTLSHSSVNRARKQMRKEEAEKIKSSFKGPKNAIVHFDGKLLAEYGDRVGEHLAVMISGNTDQCRSGKLLSAKKIEDGTGLSQANEVVASLKDWNSDALVIGACFDTTAANTGWLQGACVRIEKDLNRPLLWLPCRHHIAELFLKDAWTSIFGEDMSPYYQEFKDFQKIWDGLKKDKIQGLGIGRSIRARANMIIEFCKEQLKRKVVRDDYKECLQLVLVVLGVIPDGFTFKKPGAVHKARFMAVLIYGLKIYLFRSQLKKSTEQKYDLERFAKFICLYYIKHWFNAPIAANAPVSDLSLLKDMLEFEKIDKRVSKAVTEKLKMHTWYLNQEYVPFSLFSDLVSEEEKFEIAQKLLKTKPPRSYEFGYPEVVQDLDEDYRLSDSVFSGSYFLFDRLGFEKKWLSKPVREWKSDVGFLEMEEFVKNLLVTNDTAERGIKFIQDYAEILTKDTKERQDILQVVEKHREEIPDVKKETLKKYNKT